MQGIQRQIIAVFLDWLYAQGFRMVKIGTRPEVVLSKNEALDLYAGSRQ